MRLIVIIFLMLGTCALTSFGAFAQEFPYEQSKTYILEDSTILYWESGYDEDFTSTVGFTSGDYEDDDQRLHLRLINAVSDTTYIDTQSGSIAQVQWIDSDDDNYYLGRVNFSSSTTSDIIRRKQFSHKKQRWSIYNKSIGIYGGQYNAKRTYWHMLSDDISASDDNFCIRLFFFFLVCFAFSVIFPWWDMDGIALLGLLICFLTSLGSVIFINVYLQRQLFFPLYCLCITAFAFKIPQYQGAVRYITQIIIGCIIIIFFVNKQFFATNECIKLSDGYELNIEWQKGTSLPRRHYIRKIFSNMIPVTVESNNKRYTLYVSKYEFSSGDLDVVSNELFCPLSGSSKKPADWLSFREYQIILEILYNLTGVKPDFLSHPEFLSISNNKNHAPNDTDYIKVTKGAPDEYGLINFLDNMPEYTSSYKYGDYRIGMAADTIYKAYNTVIIAGSAYFSTDSTKFRIVSKNFRDGYVGCRLIVRPDDIGARKFTIKGHLRSDREYSNLPTEIELISIDGRCVEDIFNYESFEELLIECRPKTKRIEAIDLSKNKVFSFEHPVGLPYYDFEPVFTFVGLD